MTERRISLFIWQCLDQAAKLSSAKIDRLCSLDIHFKHVDATFQALGLE